MPLSDEERLKYLRLKKLKAESSANSQFISNEMTPSPYPGEPSFFQGVKSGLTAQPGEGVGHFIGAALPATIGGVVGGPIGAAVGETARQAAGAIVNPEETAKKSPFAIGGEVAAAGVGQKLGEVAGPYISKGAAKTGEAIKSITEWFSGKVGKAFLKASKSLNAYGHEPEKAITDEGIIAHSWESLIDKAKSAKEALGHEYRELFDSPGTPGFVKVDVNDTISPINEALTEANKFPQENKALIDRLTGLKEDIKGLIKKNSTKMRGDIVDAEKLNGIKSSLYRVTKYSGANADELPLNKVKQQVAGKIATKMEEQIPEIAVLNQRYGNLSALENAAVNREIVASRSDVIGLREFIGIPAAMMGHPLAGGAIIGSRALNTPIGGTTAMAASKAVGEAAPRIVAGAGNVVEELVKKFGGAISAYTIQKGLEKEAKDHPEIPEKYRPHLVADELKKDATFYDKDK